MGLLISDGGEGRAGVCRRGIRGQRGQALAEAGVVIPMLVLLLFGVFEFGRAFMITNMVTNAARAGARSAAITPASLRDADGIIISTTHIEDAAKAMLGDVVDGDLFTVEVEPIDDGDVPMVRVRIFGDVGFALIPATEFTVDRAVTFPDQYRQGTAS